MVNVPWLIDSVTASPLISASAVADGNVVCKAINWLWRGRRLIVALISPWFMWILFSSQAQGDMGNSVALANSKYGSDPEYQKYLSQVPLIIPKFR